MRRAMEWMVGALGGLLAPGVVAAQERPWEWGGGMMHPMWGWWGLWGFAMMLFVFLFWALVITAIVLGIRWLVRQGTPGGSDSALEILRQRYARGEINREEFDAKRKDLQR